MRRSMTLAVALAFIAAACGNGDETAASEGRVTVVASFYPIFEAAQRVGGDLVQPTNLTPAGSEPHDFELTTRDVDRLEDADLVLYFGRGFQPAVEATAERVRGRAVDLLGDDANLAPPEDGHGHAEGEEEEEHEEEELEVDPHIWLDPTRYRNMVLAVAEALAQVDPANAPTYRANAQAYGAEIEELDRAYEAGLADCERRTMVTSHAAFGYLAERYGLVQESIAGLEPESEPDPQRLAELADDIRADGTTTIFFETLVSPRVAEALAREAGVATAALDPLEGLSDSDISAGVTYLSVMRANLEALRTALGCR